MQKTNRAVEKLSVLLFVANAAVVFAANYYVDGSVATSGSGQSLASAFKTIQQAASVMQAGDICNIRAGTYRETVTPSANGTAASPITFQSYNGESVVIDGADPVTGWTQYSGSIYRAPIDWTLGAENQVFINNIMAYLARWPNVSNQANPFFDFTQYARADVPGSGNGHVYDAALPDKPANFWQNCVIWCNFGCKWSAFGTRVTSSSSKDLYYSAPSQASGWYAYPGGNPGWGTNQPNDFEMYYLSGKLDLLDVTNEWFYDGTYLYVWVPGGGDPGTMVKAKRRVLAINLSNRSYITVRNIGVFSSTISMENTNTCLLDGISAQYLNHHSHDGYFDQLYNAFTGGNGITISGSNNKVKNCTIRYAAGSAISIISGSNHEIDNNDIQYASYSHSYAEPVENLTATNVRITRNKIWYSGSALIESERYDMPVNNDNATFVLYNDLAYAEQLGDDRGAVNGQNWEVAYNWIHDIGRGLKYGVQPALYTDLSFDYSTYHHNVIWNLNGSDPAVRINNTGDGSGTTGIYVLNNTSYNTPGGFVVGNGSWTESNSFGNQGSGNFVNAAAGDFRLVNGSGAINSGSSISNPYNITYGSNGTPDRGAYEYGATSAHSQWRAGLGVTMYYLGNGQWQDTAAVVESPTFSPGPGKYGPSVTVSLSTPTSGATIYYTLDGSTPTASSSLYSMPLNISATTTVKAAAFKTGVTPSSVVSATYTISQAPYGKLTVSSVSASSTNSGSAASNSTDGSTGTEWVASATAPGWIKLDLGSTMTVDSIAIHIAGAYPDNKSITIEISTDNINFTTVSPEATYSYGQWTGRAFTPISARYIRASYGTSSQGWPSLTEFEVYGSSGGSTIIGEKRLRSVVPGTIKTIGSRYVVTGDGIGDMHVELVSAKGQLIGAFHAKDGNDLALPRNEFASGVYLVKVRCGKVNRARVTVF
jgi:hypothetical protein